MGLWSEAGLLAPGPTPPRLPNPPSGGSVARACVALAVGIPGHSGGSAPDSHRLPLTTDRYWTEVILPHGSRARLFDRVEAGRLG